MNPYYWRPWRSVALVVLALVSAWASFGYVRDISHNATPNVKEQHAWTENCRARTKLPCVP